MDSFELRGSQFWSWLQMRDGVYLSPKVSLCDYRSMNQGRGLIALQDFTKDELLFTIPESVILSLNTSALQTLLPGLKDLDEWMSLILVMLYENQKADSYWKEYFDVLPKQFDTPMFWTEEELRELKGTEVVSRIGKLKSEEQYNQIILPLLAANPQLFEIAKCGLDAFHRMGSLVLAYSFGKTDAPNEENEDEEESAKVDLAMVPLADMLNANPQLNNARLFQARAGWEMRTIRPIAKDEQIYNTYGNLPNADLLRRYGYVIPGSRDDLVEITAEMIIEVVSVLGQDEVSQHVDVLDEEDLFEEYKQVEGDIDDRAYEIPFSGKISDELLVFCLSMMVNTLDGTSIPKVKRTAELRDAVLNVLAKRMTEYDTTIEQDEKLLESNLGLRHRMAVEVRVGEKRILKKARERLDAWVIGPPAKRVKTTR